MRGLARASLLLCVALPLPGVAQFNQYTAPGSFQQRPVSRVEELEQAMDEAPWSLGRLFVEPWVAISDLAYIDDGGRSREGSDPGGDDRGADVTGTFGAGLQLYRPVASDFVFEAHFLPAYVWYRDQEERSRLNGRYGLGLYGDLGRTDLELNVARDDESRFLSNEFQQRVNVRDESASAGLNVELVSGIAVFGSASRLRVRQLDEDIPFLGDLSQLDRDEDVYRVGMRFRTRRGFQLGLGVEDSEVVFDEELFDRSNSGTSPIVELGVGGEKVWLGADVAFRSLEPLDGSEFVPFEGVTGNAGLSWYLRPRLELQLSGASDLVYSITEIWAYYESETASIGLRAGLGTRGHLRFFAGQGRDDYVAVMPDPLPRVDDIDAYGVELDIQLSRITIEVGWTRTVYDSSLPAFDRQVDLIRTGIRFGGGLGIQP